MWDPLVYQRYGDERSRPFYELVGRVGAAAPGLIVDLGCGPGNLTSSLADRWPDARVHGLDASVEMIEAARALPGSGQVTFEVADAREWTPPVETDVVISNALLQWVPGHRELIDRWIDALRPGSWLAFQVPGNFEGPSHTLLRELVASPHWTAAIGADERPPSPVWDPVDYAGDLLAKGCEVDAWETTYLHQLPVTPGAAHPVLSWMEGTALRPFRAKMADRPELWESFREQLSARLAIAYPLTHGVVFFPFRRVFAVARKA